MINGRVVINPIGQMYELTMLDVDEYGRPFVWRSKVVCGSVEEAAASVPYEVGDRPQIVHIEDYSPEDHFRCRGYAEGRSDDFPPEIVIIIPRRDKGDPETRYQLRACRNLRDVADTVWPVGHVYRYLTEADAYEEAIPSPSPASGGRAAAF